MKQTTHNSLARPDEMGEEHGGGETGPALFNGTGAIADDALPRFDSRLDGILGWGTSQHHCHISTGFSDPDGTRQKRNRRHHLSPTQQQQQQQQRPGIFPLRVSMQMRLVPTHDGRGESNHNHGRFPPTTHTEKKKRNENHKRNESTGVLQKPTKKCLRWSCERAATAPVARPQPTDLWLLTSLVESPQAPPSPPPRFAPYWTARAAVPPPPPGRPITLISFD